MSPSIFILGFGPGLSTAIASLFASKGYNLGLGSRTAQKVRFGSVNVASAVGDGMNPLSLVTALDELVSKLGRPEVIVYNIAKLAGGDLGTVTEEDMTEHFMLGPVSGLIVGQWAEKNLVGEKKSLIYTGGGLSRMVFPDRAALGASKAALLHLSNNLNAYLKPKSIHVATITIRGYIKEDSQTHSPTQIAQAYWDAHEAGLEGDAEVLF